MADIFLSYKREDIARARQIENALEAVGWTVFWDTELLPGDSFREALASELDKARCVMVLWSSTSTASAFVIDEAETGRKRGHLVSVRIDDVEMPLGFRQLQAANLIDWNGDVEDPGFKLLLRGIARHVLPTTPPAPRPRAALRNQAARPTLLLAGVFLVNWLETSLDPLLTPDSVGAQAGYPITYAFIWFERYLSFASHDATNIVASHGYSFSYFFVLPLVCLFVAWNLARRADPVPYRALSLAVAIDYLASLPFFIFFPVPERWSFLESEAMLLSDKWSDKLIEALRPISGLDNSFPSTHVSLMVLVATACLIFKVPLRKCTIPLGATVVLATFVLGIHWIPDVLAGMALGIASMLLAWRLTRAGRLSFLWGVA